MYILYDFNIAKTCLQLSNEGALIPTFPLAARQVKYEHCEVIRCDMCGPVYNKRVKLDLIM